MVPLPIYYRNMIYDEDEKEDLWLFKLDQQVRYVMGEKVDVSEGTQAYFKVLEWYQRINEECGFGSRKGWDEHQYLSELAKL